MYVQMVENSKEIKEEIKHQEEIGWEILVEGLVSQKIVNIQQKHYEEKILQNQATRWAINLIKQLWKVLYEIWNYRNEKVHKNPNE